MNLRYIDWIWNIRGNLALAPGLSGNEAFDRLEPLFLETGTSHERSGDTLTFTKKDPAAQDKMSVFDRGVLKIEAGETGPELRYSLTSKALLFCFLAPLLFIGLAQLTVAFGKTEKPKDEAASTSGKSSDGTKKPEKKDKVLKLHPIDVALGAPAPEKPKKDKAEEGKKKPSPTAGYVFAGIFATLFLVGRILEDQLVRSLFNKRLMGT